MTRRAGHARPPRPAADAKGHSGDPRAVRWAAALYRALSALLPRPLRAAYGAELEADFRRLARGAHERAGAVAVAGALMRALGDVARRIPLEHWRERTDPGPGLGPRRRRPEPRRRRVRTGERMRMWLKDLQVAARTLAARPGFTVVAVLTLGLGIGANAAIFNVVNAVLLRPLAYPESERIVLLRHHAPGIKLDELENAPGFIAFYQERARSFSSYAAVDDRERNLTGTDRPERISLVDASPEFFTVFGTRPFMGRPFTAEDVGPGPQRVGVLTHAGWSRHFGRDRDILGRVVELDGSPVEIIGVMPRGFEYPDDETAMILPMWVDPDVGFSTFGISGIGRLAPGVGVEEASAEVAQLQAQVPEVSELSAEFLESAQWRTSVTPLQEVLVGDIAATLWIVLATAGFVLLIACANVANLFLVRAEGRQREVAIRGALGATRGALTRAFLSESVLMAAAGGVLGMLLASAGIRLMVAYGPEQLPRLHEVGVDGATLLFAAAVSLAAGLLLGLLPLPRFLSASRFASILREGRAETGSRQRHRTRKVLIAVQVALALVLLTGSGLMLRSFERLRSVDPGFRTDGVLAVGVSLGDYPSQAQGAAFYQRLLEEVRRVPGVEVAGATNALPIELNSINGSSFRQESRPRADDEIPTVVMYSAVTPGYFEALGIPLLTGRRPEDRDHAGGPPVVWVSESFARDHLGGDALGERISLGGDSTWMEVVGVVGDVRAFGLKEEIRPMAYMSMSSGATELDLQLMVLTVRAAGEPMAVLPGVRAAVQRVAPDVPLTVTRTMDEVVSRSMADTSFTMAILTIAALVALLLGAIGLYGVISYVVSQRTREIGVRVALGALPAKVSGMLVRQGVAVVLVGLVVGLAGAFALTRLMEGVLFEVSARDPWVFGTVVVVLLAVGVLASWLPARRAARISPLEALRAE